MSITYSFEPKVDMFRIPVIFSSDTLDFDNDWTRLWKRMFPTK